MMTALRFPNGLETRHAATELRADTHGRRLSGYAATFGTEARIGNAFTEILLPGCFAASLTSGNEVVALADHDHTKVLGRTRAGTLKLTENGMGLWFEIDVAPTTAGNDVIELVRSGNAGGMSFGFTVAKDGERWSGQRRELRAVNLVEVSCVSAWPAYEGTSIAARSRALHAATRTRLLAWGML